MSRYVNMKVNISKGQKDKIKHTIQAASAVSIHLSHSDLSGKDMLVLTQVQVNKLAKAYKNGIGTMIKMSKTQVE